MDLGTVTELMRSAVVTILTVASPVLLVAMGVGLIVSIIQATTSIQDQTLTFVPKILAILGVLAALFGWMITRLTTYATIIFEKNTGSREVIDWPGIFAEARLFFVVFARVAALLRTAPLTSSSAIPPLARGGFMLLSTVVFYSFVGDSYGQVPDIGLAYAMIIVAEILLGIIMGLFLQIIFAIFQTAGQLFSFQMGFGASQVYDPLAQVEIPLIGQFLNLIGLAVFLSVSGMQRLFFTGLAGSFRVMKGTDFLVASDYLNETLITSIGRLFEQSLILAFPILGTLLLISVTMGLLAKAAPQMNLLMVGFPIQIGVGFIIMLVATPFLAEKMSQLVDMGFGMIESYFLATQEASG